MTPERREKIISTLSRRQRDVAVVIDNIHDPHNVGAILRSCDAFGVGHVYLSYTYQEMPRLRDIRSTSAASAARWLEIVKSEDYQALISSFVTQGMNIYTTEVGQFSVPISTAPLLRPSVFVFGNEHQGVSRHWQEAATANVLIPMFGFVESLNVSVAAAICLYELMRQRHESGMYVTSTQPQNWMGPWLGGVHAE